MRKLVIAVLVATLGGVAVAGEVIVPRDNTPFTIPEGATVRIPAKGVAGTLVNAKVLKGTAKEVVNIVSPRGNGKSLKSQGSYEVLVWPSGKGEYEVEVTVTPPNTPPVKTSYNFTVK
jgi:hypothetical protein